MKILSLCLYVFIILWMMQILTNSIKIRHDLTEIRAILKNCEDEEAVYELYIREEDLKELSA